MNFETTPIDGLLIASPTRISDSRGHFIETFRQSAFFDAVDSVVEFVQDNQSRSIQAGTLRGLHAQLPPHDQGKLVRCLRGEILDVAVDVRRNSKTFGKWFSIRLSADNAKQLWIPTGFLHGFCTILPDTEIAYKCTAYYNRESEQIIAWDDPDLAIDWGLENPVLSEKDRNGVKFPSFASPF